MIFRKNPKRLKLREWAKMETLLQTAKDHVEKGRYESVREPIVEVINLCGIKGDFKKKPWYETVSVFSEAQQINGVRVNLPMLNAEKKDTQTAPWDYIGREWAWWLNLFASNYGWNEAEVAKLDIDTAISLYQEIQVDEQMEHEWTYGLSEMAYEYIPSAKKSKFRPLERPKWMLVTKANYKKKEPKKIKILASMMPVGNVVKLSEEDEDAGETTKP